PVAREAGIGPHPDEDVHVARAPTEQSRVPLPGQPDPRPVVDARRDVYLESPLLQHATGALAHPPGRLGHATGASTPRHGRRAHEVAVEGLALPGAPPPPPPRPAGVRPRPRLWPAPPPPLAGPAALQRNGARPAAGRLDESDLDLGGEIGAPSGPPRPDPEQ